jgi:Ca2+/H+ antiporter
MLNESQNITNTPPKGQTRIRAAIKRSVLSLLLSVMTLTGGRATVLQGTVHLVVFAVFLFLAMVP